jgi:hypothetical protein
LVPGAIERIWSEWCAIPISERAGFAGIIAHSIDDAGRLVGARFPTLRFDGRFFELAATRKMIGEKLPCYRTDVLQQFPFPEQPGSNAYVPEGAVWVEIGRNYKLRCVDVPLRIYHRDATDDSAIMNRYVAPKSNAWGVMCYLAAILNLGASYFFRFPALFAKAAAGYVRYALHSGYSVARQGRQLESPVIRALWITALPVGTTAWLIDRWKSRRALESRGLGL